MGQNETEFATEPVPDAHTVGWLRVGMISAMVAFSLPTFVAGVEVARAVTGRQAIAAILLGGLLLAIIGSISGYIGSKTRLSSYMLARIAFGRRGAALVNLAFALSLLGWFGFNVNLFGSAVERLLSDGFGFAPRPRVIELCAGAVMTVTTLYGFRAIRTLSALLVPILMIVTVLLVASSLEVKSLTAIVDSVETSRITFGSAVSSVVGGVIVGAVILPDITRFIRRPAGAVNTAVMSYFLVNSVVMTAGGIAAIALVSNDLLHIMLVMGLGFAAFAIVIAGSWVLNSLNLYSTMLSVEATLPKLDNRLLIAVLGALGTLAAFFNIIEYFLTFLFYLAIVFVPVAGVIAVDYFFLRHAAYHEDRIVAERNVSVYALAAWASGSTVAVLGERGHIAFTGIAALDAMIASALAYFLLMRFVRRREGSQ